MLPSQEAKKLANFYREMYFDTLYIIAVYWYVVLFRIAVNKHVQLHVIYTC